MKLLLVLLLALPCPRPARSSHARAAFRRAHPCPAGVDKGSMRRCRGHVIDHVCPLACCGLDAPANMQWQSAAEAKRKDRWERDCARACAPTPRLPGLRRRE